MSDVYLTRANPSIRPYKRTHIPFNFQIFSVCVSFPGSETFYVLFAFEYAVWVSVCCAPIFAFVCSVFRTLFKSANSNVRCRLRLQTVSQDRCQYLSTTGPYLPPVCAKQFAPSRFELYSQMPAEGMRWICVPSNSTLCSAIKQSVLQFCEFEFTWFFPHHFISVPSSSMSLDTFISETIPFDQNSSDIYINQYHQCIFNTNRVKCFT